MARDPALTYRGALKILGKHNRPWLEKLDKALGGLILASPAAGLLDPVSAMAAFWGWVDQKNEAVTQLQRALDSAAESKTGGHERHQLITAAHTTLVVAAFLEVLQETIGERNYRALKISRFEEEQLVAGQLQGQGEELIDLFCQAPVSMPGAASGFQDNCRAVASWLNSLASSADHFLSGLALWREFKVPLTQVAQRAKIRYQGHYLRLAAEVPEFLVWASFGEYAALHYQLTGTRQDVLAVLANHSLALRRLEGLLALNSGTPPAHALCEELHRANRGALHDLVVPVDSTQHWGWAETITFPTIEQIYVNPRYRISPKPHGEIDWPKCEVQDDLDLRLTAHLTSAEGTTRPLLVLGHPGAGKSTLTKVLAARLPAASYTVVRVPLRHVEAEAPVYEQIQQALRAATHGRVDWADLARRSRHTIRVVLFDGLDELLQASATPRSGYLQEIADFQRREAEQEHPVVTFVTSRTTVADRVRIPLGTPVIKLEDFHPEQIATWLRVWHQSNPGGLTIEDALGHLELTGQPLLLLMLALYAADPDSPSLAAELSRAALYRELLHSFVRREVSKKDIPADSDQFREAVRDQLWRLSVAALGMFNRGRQDITDAELSADIAALSGSACRDLGRRTIAEFFFIHSPEARSHAEQRHYEFLHATFSEYLVASQVLAEIDELVASRYGLTDDPLFALLSHQPLAINQSVLAFVIDLIHERSPEHQARIARLLAQAFAGYRQRQGSARFADYRPLPVDNLRELAAYSANLMLLRVFFGPGGIPKPMNWESTVDLWRAGLDQPAWLAAVNALWLTEERLVLDCQGVSGNLAEFIHARLTGDEHREAVARFGTSIASGLNHEDADDRWDHLLFSSLLGSWASTAVVRLVLPDLPDTPTPMTAQASRLLNRVLLDIRSEASYQIIHTIIDWVLEFDDVLALAPHTLAALVAEEPMLLVDFPQLREPERYETNAAVAALHLGKRSRLDIEGVDLLNALRAELPPPDLTAAFCGLYRAESPKHIAVTRLRREE